MRVFVVNVGVNASDAAKRRMRSPIFDDGTFEMLPIKESKNLASKLFARQYRRLPSWTGRTQSLAVYLPEKYGVYGAHDDPDFSRMTYGDIQSGRAGALKSVQPGDLLLFLARLWSFRDGRFEGPGAFHFVGSLLVTHNLAFGFGVATRVPDEVRARVEKNAHTLRAQAGDTSSYRVLVGDPRRSARFERAIEVTRAVAGTLFGGDPAPDGEQFQRNGEVLLNKNGQPRRFSHFHSITRTIQWYLDDTRDEDRRWCECLVLQLKSAGRAKTPEA